MRELSTIAQHAGTVLAGQLAIMAFGVTDTIVAGRYSSDALAALSVASAVFVSVYVSLMGVLQALLPIWSELHGRGQSTAIGTSFRQSLYLALGFTLLGMLVLLFPGPLLRWTQVPESMQADVHRYLVIVGWALPSAMFFRLYTTLNQALGHPQLVTWLQVGALAFKVPLSIWLTFGGWGLPAQGAAGCAWATLLVDYAMAVIALVLMRRQRLYTPLQIWRPMPAPDWPHLRQCLRLGVPAGLSILVEVTSFTLVALFVARQGALAAASHQIAANVAAVLYMVPLSLGIAISARVSWWRGAGHEAMAQKLAWSGVKIAAACGLLLAAGLLLLRGFVPHIYTPDPAVIALTSSLLLWVALYHAADSVQCVSIFLLRCWHVTVLPLLVYCSLLWGAGLAGGYWLAYHHTSTSAQWSGVPTPFWMASGVALTVVAAVFAGLMQRTLRPIQDNAQPIPSQ